MKKYIDIFDLSAYVIIDNPYSPVIRAILDLVCIEAVMYGVYSVSYLLTGFVVHIIKLRALLLQFGPMTMKGTCFVNLTYLDVSDRYSRCQRAYGARAFIYRDGVTGPFPEFALRTPQGH